MAEISWSLSTLFFIIALSLKTINAANFNVREDVQVGSTLSSSLPAPATGFHYSLFEKGNTVGSSPFSISSTGKITVKKKLNYVVGNRNKYDLIAVKRKDGTTLGGTTEVVNINIIDVNNHDPVFKKREYVGQISEGLAAGSPVQGLEDCFATDKDSSGVSKYVITKGNKYNLFKPRIKDISGLKLLVIETTGTLDRETLKTTPFINLEVKAIDGGNPERQSAATKIQIRILDKNDNSPVFDQANWMATIQENSPIMTSVIKVKASDKDEGSNSQLYYYLKDLQDNFYIDPYTGVIYVASPLNYKKKSSYSITVVVVDRAIEKTLNSTSTVVITVVDVAGYPTSSSINRKPEFKTKKYDVKIRGDMPINAFVLLAKATDPDGVGNNNGELQYSMTASGANPFKINPVSGVVSVNSKLPSISTPLSFEVSVKDGGHLSAAKVLVDISIRSINTNLQAPFFNPSTVNVDLKEDAGKNVQVFRAQATDTDGLMYSITEGTGLGRFAIDSATGVVTPKVTFKSGRVYDLYIQATDKNMFKLSSTMYARINVRYSDNIKPVFSEATYVAEVEESEPAGTFVAAIIAKYPDPSKTLKCSVIGPLPIGLALNPVTCIITTTMELNYESVKKMTLEIEARVVGTSITSKTLVVVQVKNKNDETPVFPRSNINLKVPENQGFIPNLVCLFATDRDGTKTNKLVYSITSGNEDNMFSVDKQTGQLSVQNLDYEKKNLYNIEVQASDGFIGADGSKRVAKANVKVVVEDDTSFPEPANFGTFNHFASITENAASITTIKTMPVVGTAGSFLCDFGFDTTPLILSLFTVSTQSSGCLVKTSSSLKWSKKHPSYKFTVRAITKSNAMQFSSAQLTVSVLDTNDNLPQFSQDSYATSVSSTSKIGSTLLTVAATDEDEGSNGDVQYDIISSIDSNRFEIGRRSGIVTVRDNLIAGKQYKVQVRASDLSSSPKTKDVDVMVSVHDGKLETPKFGTQDTVSVSEDTSLGTVINAKATITGGTIDYSIVGGNTGSVFNIDANGVITQNQKLDYETKTEYKVIVRATKKGSSPPVVTEKVFTIKVVDSNDNAPQFNVQGSTIDVTIVSNGPAGTVASLYKAFDKDSGMNGKLKYTVILNPGSSAIPFTANADTGIVTTSREITTTGSYNFILRASDQGLPVKTADLNIQVTVVAGTKPPSFTDARFRGNMDDNTPIGRSVGSIQVKDDTIKDYIRYEIVSGDPDNSFCIDYTKVVHTQKDVDRDIAKKDNYYLTVVMKYKNVVSSTLLWLTIKVDQNDNSPVFKDGYADVTKTIPESSPKGTLIYTVQATDNDGGLKGSVEYSMFQVANKYSADKFAVNAVTGAVTLNNILDYEKLDTHVLTIKASDKASLPRFALKNIIVRVTDTNDEAPVFSNPRYEAEIPKDSKAGTKVLQVYASDLDSGTNGEVFYDLTNDRYSLFAIDRATGLITLKETIGLISVDSFNLAARATDRGTPAKSGQANVIVRTTTSDGVPKFALPRFHFKVTENTMLKSLVKALSVDPLTYSIVSGNTANRFQIDKDTGELTSIQALDAEQGELYNLTIMAQDNSARSSSTQAIIKVINVNDNEPTFTNAIDGRIEKVITNKVVVGEQLLRVIGQDLDNGDLLTYEIIEKAQQKQFKIEPKTGVVKLKEPLTNLNAGQNFAEFTVRATDRGTPRKFKDVKVRIVFANFKPDHTKIKKFVPETAPVSSPAVVTDLPRIYPLGSYQIMYPKVHPFQMNARTGEISLKESLDFEKVQSYDIVIQENNSLDKTQYINYKILITVKDTNDNTPIFNMPNLKAKVNTNARTGTEVIKLVATDADSGAAGKVSFEMVTKDVPFTINPVTNQVEVSKMNALTQTKYLIDVKASDGGIPKRTSGQVKLEISVVNEPPVFEKSLYKFSISENANVDKVLGSIKAKSLSGIAVSYKIIKGNTGDKFRIDTKGDVLLQRPLDYEVDLNSYSLVVEASEIAAASLKSTTNVVIQIININDNPPRFTKVEYTSNPIPEDVKINSLVMTVSATDADCGTNGICTPGFLTYTTDAYSDTFRLDPITGEIRTVRSLDADTKQVYKFYVRVEDSGIIKRSSIASVVVTVKEVNDNAPVFKPNKETLYIAEKITTGVVIKVVEAHDLDSDRLSYAIVQGNEKNMFAIDAITGKVTVRNSLFDVFHYTLRISATDGKYTGYFTLVIKIDDKNDKTPVFRDCLNYRLSIDENMGVGASVNIIKEGQNLKGVVAIDDDEGRNGEIEYSLLQISSKGGSGTSGVAPSNVGSTETTAFTINPKNGTITANKRFDRETQATYTVLVIAKDGGANRTDAERNSAACQLTININDKNDRAPVFAISSYEVSIWDQTPPNTVILQTSALDEDVGTNAQIVYSLVGAPTNVFRIPNQMSGGIALGSSVAVGTYEFTVQAANPGTSLKTGVKVKVIVGTTKPPKFTQSTYSVSLKESEKAGFEIKSLLLKANIQSPLPNSNIVYNLPKGNLIETNRDVFAINSETGLLKVAGELNYEVTKNYIVYVQAKDEGNDMVAYAIVYVTILDVNDNTPLFHLPKYEYVTVTEGTGRGFLAGQVYASDRDSTTNAELVYSIVGSSDAFTIDATTGMLKTKRTFDREKRGDDKITIFVSATDKGKPPQDSNVYVTVQIIDINDNPPIFTSREFSGSVRENAAIGFQLLAIKATDADAGDNAKVEFFITGGNEQGHFSTSKSTFSKDTSTAWIEVAKPLDREKKSQYKLTITASDSKFNVQATVNIKVLDANDNAPEFLKSVYLGSIFENAASGTSVTGVSAVDKDTAAVQQPIKYLLGKDAGNMFKIDSTTGVITTGDIPFDREKKDEYRFTVIATDGKLTGTALVRCTVKDVNDQAPYFPGAPYTRYIKEGQPAGTIVGYVPARDNDDPKAGGNAKITYSIEGKNQGFKIKEDTGLITTLKTFDRESKVHTPVYRITVRAKDGGVPVQKNETVVTIIVTDANDNDPKFTKSRFDGKIKECAPVGTVVTKVTAKDDDDPNTINAQMMFYVVSSDNNAASYFHVDDRTGVITVADGLDFEKASKYELKVGVKDRGVPMRPQNREEVASVVIEVTDCNDNQPMFVPPTYNVNVPENVVVGKSVLTVTAVDKDRGSNGEFVFKIVDTEKNFRFGINNLPADKNKGVIKVLYPLDREDIAHHVFRVSASDKGAPSLTGYASVNISLTDINDNGPHFDKPDYCGQVEEEVKGYQRVAKIRVSDPDTKKYSCPCKFSIQKGDTSLFELRNADGTSVEVVTKPSAIFDREKKSVYTIYIVASDQGNPPMNNVTFVKVQVLDKNDMEPSSGGSLSLLVNAYKGKFIGGPVGKVYIIDNDEGSKDIYDHKLTSQTPGSFFSVNPKTGDIIAAPNVPVGKYKLAFRSVETNRLVGEQLKKSVTSSAVVTVRGISEKQAKTSVAIRMTGLVKSSTCKELAYPEFEELLAKILNVDKKLVTVFSAQEVKDLHRGVDIRFAVKKAPKPGYAGDDSEYVDPINLIPILNAKKKEIEKETGGKVASVGIDACAKETCAVGFCYNDIQPQRTYTVVTDDNGLVPANPSSKTFISIDMKVLPICLVGPKKPKSCKDKPCLYGGKCTDLKTGGYSCACAKKSSGPECQVAIKSFKTKDSYLWVKPFNYFYEGTLSFEFITKEANGVLLYQGPMTKISDSETKDFLAVVLVDGRIQISVNQGDKWRIFKATVPTKETLNNGVFHHVEIYKRGKFIRVIIDRCRDAPIVESSKSSYQDRSSCEITGTIGGPFKFVNGMNPLQLGGIKRKDLLYPPLTKKDSFAGCLRNVYDNGIMYDLSKSIEERDIGSECPFFAKCPTCYHGYCRTTFVPFVCICDFGWTGPLCNERAKAQHYLADSYTEYSFPNQRAKRRTWVDKYSSLYKVQVRTKVDGFVVYEASSVTYGALQEYSILEVVNKTMQYRYNVGDGAKTLILRNVVVGDGKWHNVTLNRQGNFATLDVQGQGMVSGTIGTHRLLETDGFIYAGGVPSKINAQGPTDMQGCLSDYRIGEKNLDGDVSVKIRRVNVEPSCPCLYLNCLNGGICHAGSPPYCICPPGYTGLNCGILVTQPEAGTRAVMATGSLLGLVVIVVVFLLAVVMAALLLAGKFAKKKAVPVYVDDDPRDNIMPYHDEGAGEDDFHNYDLEKLLKHAGAGRAANGAANGAAIVAGGGGAGAGGKDIEKEPLLAEADASMVNAVAAGGVVKREKHARFEAANVESVDVARFITSRLAEADSEDAAYPRDTLLHYGYEGEGSDVDDLSELGESEDESDDDEADFMFLQDWGAKFDNLNKIFNPPSADFEEDV